MGVEADIEPDETSRDAVGLLARDVEMVTGPRKGMAAIWLMVDGGPGAVGRIQWSDRNRAATERGLEGHRLDPAHAAGVTV